MVEVVGSSPSAPTMRSKKKPISLIGDGLFFCFAQSHVAVAEVDEVAMASPVRDNDASVRSLFA